MPSYKEIKSYHDEVVENYGLRGRMTFNTEVEECFWCEDISRWTMKLRNVITGEVTHHECQILFAATGQLVEPKPCDIPGSETFKGSIFHSARWEHNVDLDGKNVIVIGNGCKHPWLFLLLLEILILYRYRCPDCACYRGSYEKLNTAGP
jgi:cation diffusion facilitator CzcD-associated flavoprotein CzcO